jgi:hypothetical protein
MAVKSLKRSSVKSTQKGNAMNAGYSFQDFELIESVFVASTTASVIFNNLNQYATDYKHLQIRLIARGSGATTAIRDLFIRLNANTGNNYSAHNLRGAGVSVSSTAGSSLNIIAQEPVFVGNSNTANIFGAAIIDILDPFSTTKNTTVRTMTGFTAATSRVSLGSGAFYSTAAITSVTIFPDTDSILAGSRFSLYGIR